MCLGESDLFVFNQSFSRYKRCVGLFSIKGFTFFSEWLISFRAHFFPCVPLFAVGVASSFFWVRSLQMHYLNS